MFTLRFGDMSFDARHNELKRNISLLRRELLRGNENQSKLKGFFVLAHAEIENFVEDIARNVAEQALNRWVTNGNSSVALVALMAFYVDQNWDAKLDTRVRRVVKKFLDEVVERNHGVRADHVDKMLSRIGIKIEAASLSLEADLESFGSVRGQFAHTSIGKVRTLLNKVDVLRQLNAIISDLKNLKHEAKRVTD